MTELVYRWRRLDTDGLEVMRLDAREDGVRARSNVVFAASEPFAVAYEWSLDTRWRTRSLSIQLFQDETREMLIERAGDAAWRVNQRARSDLDGCEEVDLSITPFCNTLALRRFGPPPGGAGELVALYVDFPSLTGSPSRQRYERLGDREFRYVDLGFASGFEARLSVQHDGIVRNYEGLFELLESP
jgi:uncharacterized protein